MSVWTTKSLSREKEYVVLKHKLRGINYTVQGVKFRDGFGVVEKNSKTYYMLKKMPIFSNTEEYPLIYLKNLKCITRTNDINTIFGRDVYNQYLIALNSDLDKKNQENKEQEEKEHLLPTSPFCHYRLAKNYNFKLCSEQVLEESPSHYCRKHLLDDPKLAELGIKVPKYMTKDEIAPMKEKVIKQLNKIKKEITNGELVRSETSTESQSNSSL